MAKQKLIDSIKKNAQRQIESEIQASVVKEMYGTSKRAIKKLKKQILKELQQDMFAGDSKKKKSKKSKPSDVEETYVHTNTVDVEEITKESPKKEVKKEEFPGNLPYVPGRIFEYRGFKFDVDRMSMFVTGKNKEDISMFKDKLRAPLDKINDLYEGKDVPKVDDKKDSPSPNLIKGTTPGVEDLINKIKSGSNRDLINKHVSKPAPEMGSPISSFTQGFNLRPGIPTLASAFPARNLNVVPATKSFVKTTAPKLTPARKEEVEFFVGKLKEGIDNLGKGEKNINYRKKVLSQKANISPNSEIYVFTYEKLMKSADDFSLSFELDFDIYTYGANVVKFDFNIGGFKFDNSFVEVLDMAKVLDAVGMNLSSYIEEIEEINNSTPKNKKGILERGADKFTHQPLTKEEEPKVFVIRPNTKVETFIDDAKIVKTLNNNEIFKMKDLKRYEDFSEIKGIGEKSAKKITDSINDYLLLKQQ
jgi:DNA uptake protein ComE-like DNA-binding protein